MSRNNLLTIRIATKQKYDIVLFIMHKDGAGNLVFEKGEGLDKDQARLIHGVIGTDEAFAAKPTGNDPWRKRRIAQAMIDAGVTPTDSDVDASDAKPLTDRFRDFLADYSDSPSVVVVREDEIDPICEKLNGPLDYDASRPNNPWYEGHTSRRAQELVGEIATFEAGKVPEETRQQAV